MKLKLLFLLIGIIFKLLTTGECWGDPSQQLLEQAIQNRTPQPGVIHPQQPVHIPVPQGPIIVIYAENQVPQVFKMPEYAFIGTRPLGKGDKIIKAVRYGASGKTLFRLIPEFHEKTYLKWNCNPSKMRMLVISKNINRSFSTSGNISANWSDYTNWNQYGQMSKGASSNMNTTGSIAPSYSQSWTSTNYDVWFFEIEP